MFVSSVLRTEPKCKLQDLSAMLTFYSIDSAHALDTLPAFKLMPLGALPPDTVGCVIASHPEVGTQLHPLYVHSGGLGGLYCSCQGRGNTGDLLLLLLLPEGTCSHRKMF